ncbi:MAG: hypothetical protein NVSMB18_08440 [Acetobacteraceae bacterium]
MILASSRLGAVLATALVLAVIVHGSLWPYEFMARPGRIGPFDTLLGSWADPPSGLGDLVANILLYVPFGFFAALALGRGMGRLLLVALAGLLLCTTMEVLQFYDEGRVTNMSDVYLNTFGTALGAVVAAAVGNARLPLIGQAAANPVPTMLLGALLAYRLFPYVPTINLHKYWDALKPVVFGPWPTPDAVLRYAAIWLTGGELLAAVFGFGLSLLLTPLLIGFVLAGKIAIEGSVITRAELAGVAIAVLARPALGGSRKARVGLVAVVLLAAVVAERLQPFAFAAEAQPFGWLPFRGFLHGSMAVNTASFLEKLFFYGSLLWLLGRAGMGRWAAAVFVAAVLFATSWAETMLPDRSAEITDTVMAIAIAGLIALLEMAARRPSR